jgi:prepilin-type N-terminal cleavage/methylation domain-containing protein
MTPPGRKPLHGEDGFALIEVLVSALVLAIVAAAVLALLQTTTRSAAAERQHAQAFSLAQEDQARLRSLRLSTLNRISQENKALSEHTYTLGGTVFTVKSEGVFINNSTRQPSNCTSGQTSADYVQITSTVSWGGHKPVTLQSIVSPSNGSLDPNHGTLLITAKKVGNIALPGLGLKGSGPGTFSGTTDSTGCANFSDLPAGNYVITPSGAGLVGIDGKPPHAVEFGVSAGTSSTLPLQYDYGASIPVEFEYRVGSSNEFKPAKLDSVFTQNSVGTGEYWSPTKARELLFTAGPIYPFSNGDSIWAGSCAINNPENSAGIATYTFHSGEVATTPLHLKVPALELTIKSGTSIVSGATITITDENCKPEGKVFRRTYVSQAQGHQSNLSNGQPEYGLPYGSYEICASGLIAGHNRRVFVKKISVKSFTSTKSETLDISGTTSEKDQVCPS